MAPIRCVSTPAAYDSREGLAGPTLAAGDAYAALRSTCPAQTPVCSSSRRVTRPLQTVAR